jgi:hypothetical protein
MKSRFYSLVLGGMLVLAAPAVAQDAHPSHALAVAKAGKLIPVSEKDRAWAAEARKTYPLEVCVTSDEKLGSMGKSPEYIYRVAGQPDRLVMFCCEGCEEDFMKEPVKYLAKIDAAAKSKALGNSADKARR